MTNTSVNEKVAAAQKELADKLAKIEYEDSIRKLCPSYDAPKWITYHKYNDVDSISYEAKDAADVARILSEWRDMYGRFLPVGKYQKSCCVVTAHPWKEYADQEALKAIEDDGIEARNSKGKGFSSVEFTFYYRVEGRKLEVKIALAFRSYIKGFEGHIFANYDRRGEVTTVRKDAPEAYRGAAYAVNFGGDMRDSADWRGVFNYDSFMTAIGE